MKYLLSLLACMICLSAVKVNIPDDENKLTVTVFAHDQAEAKTFSQCVASYIPGNHYNVYTPSNQFFKTRFANATLPSAYVQDSNGNTIWSSTPTSSCPLRRWDRQPVEEEKAPEPTPEPTPAPPPAPEGPNPLIFVGLGVLGIAVGAGSKFYAEMKSK